MLSKGAIIAFVLTIPGSIVIGCGIWWLWGMGREWLDEKLDPWRESEL